MNNPNISYDNLSYPNYVFADTHPSRLAAIGKFFGLNSPNSQKCRVLEIGCAGGMNSLSHAVTLPDSEFIAIDASAPQIETANKLKNLSAIKNVEFHATKVESINNQFGEFDYIICHGVFSWVPEFVQHEILSLIRRKLTDNGIAFISYNCLPGWHIQNIFRDALLYRTEGVEDPQIIAQASKDFLNLFQQLLPKKAKEHLEPNLVHLLNAPDSYLAHEHLSEINNAYYFKDFNNLCNDHGLIYLADSDLGSMIPKEFEPKLQDKIAELSEGRLSKMEQYLDIFRLRQFRKTLLCKYSARPDRQLNPDRLLTLFIAAARTNLGDSYKSKQNFRDSRLKPLDILFPSCVSVSEFAGEENLLPSIFEEVIVGNIEIRDHPCPIMKEASSIDRLSPLAKALIPFGRVLPNLRSESVNLSDKLHQALLSKEEVLKNDLEELSKLGLMIQK